LYQTPPNRSLLSNDHFLTISVTGLEASDGSVTFSVQPGHTVGYAIETSLSLFANRTSWKRKSTDKSGNKTHILIISFNLLKCIGFGLKFLSRESYLLHHDLELR